MTTTLPGGWRLYGRTVFGLLTVLFAVGTAGHLIPAVLPLMLKLTPGFLLLTGALVLPPALAAGGGRFAGWVLGAYGCTFFLEAAGVRTGAIFGAYAYGPTLGWHWLDVPLVIAFNWVMVVHGAICVAGRLVPRRAGSLRWPALVLLAGLIAMAFDFILEPVAIRLDYWHWAGGAIPLQNYVAWFVIAAVAAAFHPRRMHPDGDLGSAGRLAGAYVGLQAVFFLLLRAVWHWTGG